MHSSTINRSLEIFKFLYVGACVDAGGNIERGKFPESVGSIIDLSGRWNRGGGGCWSWNI